MSAVSLPLLRLVGGYSIPMNNLPHWRRMWTLNCASVAQGLPAPYDELKLYGMMYEEESAQVDEHFWWERPPRCWIADVLAPGSWWRDYDAHMDDAEVTAEDMRELADMCYKTVPR